MLECKVIEFEMSCLLVGNGIGKLGFLYFYLYYGQEKTIFGQ